MWQDSSFRVLAGSNEGWGWGSIWRRQITQAGLAALIAAGILHGGLVAVQGPASSCPCALWADTVTPSMVDAGPDSSVELGVMFRADADGTISALRFYKSAANLGPHTGSLWTTTGSLIAQVTFVNETADGWQQATLSTPVSITAGTTYIASYHTNAGHYAYGAGAFASGVDNAPLHVPAGSSGVYRYGSASDFPTAVVRDNYWVDVVFSPAGPDITPPAITATTPMNGATNVSTISPVTVSFSEALDAATVNASTIELFDASTTAVPATVTYNSATNAAMLTPSRPLNPTSSYSMVARGGTLDPRIKDRAGNALLSNVTWSFVTGATPACPCTIWAQSATPSTVDAGDAGAVEVGVRFRADTTGAIAGVRFYKSAANTGAHIANLWTQSGTLLASASSTYETASGWQEVLFSAPIPISANTSYVASYHTNTGHYSSSLAFFAANGVDSPPLHAVASGVDGPNGVYAYGTASTFPSQSYNATNYWVDVIFAPPSTSDTAPPSIALSAPNPGSSVSGTQTVSANASDNVGVVGVQFTLDGANLGAERLTPPYTISWTTNGTPNGSHVLGAVARDAAGNRAQATSVPVTIANTATSDPAQVGQWSPPIATPVVAVHMALLHTGRVVMWNGQDNHATAASFFDPATDGFSPIQNMNSELFCAGHTLLDDGRLLVVGGNANVPGLLGIQDANLLDPLRQSWTLAAPMAYRRWYPTATGLPDGRVLVTSGGQTCESCIAEIPEVYNPATNTWTLMTRARLNLPLYPFMFVLPDGRVLNAGGSGEVTAITRVLNLASETWTTIDSNLTDGGSAAMYQPGKIIKSGTPYDDRPTGTPASRVTWVLDMTQPTPAWRQSGAMAFPRAHHNLTLLPDGNVLVTGGSLTTNGIAGASPVYAAEVWSPQTEQWTTLASMEVPRLYHSSALLLPDGRVMTAGGGAIIGAVDYRSTQIYSPPYLFKGSRPVVTAAPSVVQYGSDFTVATPDAGTIAAVSLIRLGVVTHAFDENQQFIPLTFQTTGGGLTVQAPANGNLAPPGYYMLFLINGNGVPSVASFVQLPSSIGDTQAPTAPAGLNATPSIGTATLTWSASTDNTAVTGYDVYRATGPGVAPTTANRIGASTTLSYVDVMPATGAYYYVVTARDAAGNVSLPSNEVRVAAMTDTTPPSVALTSPADGSTIAGAVALTASASDNVAVIGVQFKVDGTNMGPEVTLPPYSMNWNTPASTNGVHSVTAVARDGAGNRAETLATTVFVANAVSVPGLVAAFGFNEGAGHFAADASGNGNTGTIAGARWTTGRFGNALAFDGATTWVTVNDSSTLHLAQAVTLEAWVNPDSGTSWQSVVLKERTDTGLAFALYGSDDAGIPNGTVNAGADLNARASTNLPTNTWSHLAVTYDGTLLQLFVNGQLASTQQGAGPITTSAEPLRIGGNAVWGEFFSGLIDEVRIYNRVLNPTEIQADMMTPIGQ